MDANDFDNYSKKEQIPIISDESCFSFSTQVNKYAEDVASVYDVIDPGYQKERGTILGTLCEVITSGLRKLTNVGF